MKDEKRKLTIHSSFSGLSIEQKYKTIMASPNTTAAVQTDKHTRRRVSPILHHEHLDIWICFTLPKARCV